MDVYDDSYGDDASFDDDIFVDPPVDGDAVEHLWNAAHELLRAVRTIVDAADEFVESQRGAMGRGMPREDAPERESRVRRIDIDGRDATGDPGDRSSGQSEAPGATSR